MLLLRLAAGDVGAQGIVFAGRFPLLARNSLTLAALLALLLGFTARDGRWLQRVAARIVGLGYAVPGSVIAVAVLIPVTRFDHPAGQADRRRTRRNLGLLRPAMSGIRCRLTAQRLRETSTVPSASSVSLTMKSRLSASASIGSLSPSTWP